MHKNIIKTDNYEGEERRNGYPVLSGNLKSWAMIYAPAISIIGIISTVSIFVFNAKTTTAMATNTACDVKIIQNENIVRDYKLSNLEDFKKELKATLEKFTISQNTTNDRLARIEEKISR